MATHNGPPTRPDWITVPHPAVAGCHGQVNMVLPGEHVAQMATTPKTPRAGYEGTYNYFDPGERRRFLPSFFCPMCSWAIGWNPMRISHRLVTECSIPDCVEGRRSSLRWPFLSTISDEMTPLSLHPLLLGRQLYLHGCAARCGRPLPLHAGKTTGPW
jgi:hypothetical protein